MTGHPTSFVGVVAKDAAASSLLVVARRPELVRALVLVGCSRPQAEDQVQTALVRCYPAWPRVRCAADPDAYVYKVQFNSLKDSRARRWWGEQPTEVLPTPRSPSGDLPEEATTGLAGAGRADGGPVAEPGPPRGESLMLSERIAKAVGATAVTAAVVIGVRCSVPSRTRFPGV